MGYIEKGHAKTFVKFILWLVIISFVVSIFVSWGAQRTSISIGEQTALNVNGTPISPDDLTFFRDFSRYLRERVVPRYVDPQTGRLDPGTVLWARATSAVGNSLVGGTLMQYSGDERRETMLADIVRTVGEMVLASEARAAGIRAPDSEITKLLASIYTDSEGKFFGQSAVERDLEVYQMSSGQHKHFREMLRRHILAKRYADNLYDAALPAIREAVRQLYEDENIRTTLHYVVFTAIDYLAQVQYGDGDLRAYLDEHTDEFAVADMLVLDQDLYADFVKTKLTDEEIQKYYDESRDSEFTEAERRDIRKIVVNLPEGADEEAEAAARERVRQIYDRLERPGESFATVAADVSDFKPAGGPEAVIGGLEFDENSPEPDFMSAVFSLKPPAGPEEKDYTTEPVRTAQGLEIIQLVAIHAGRTKPLEEVRDGIAETLADQKARAEARTAAEELRREAETKPLEQLAEPQYVTLMRNAVAIKGEEEVYALGDALASLGRVATVDRLLSTAAGKVTDPVRLSIIGEESTSSPLALFKITAAGESLKERFDDLRAALVLRYTKLRSRELAETAASGFAAGLGATTSVEDFKAAAEASGKEAADLTASRLEGAATVGDELMKKALEVQPPAVIGPENREGSFYVALLTDRTGIDEQAFAAEAAARARYLIELWMPGQPIFFGDEEVISKYRELLDAQISFIVKKTEVLANQQILRAMFGGER